MAKRFTDTELYDKEWFQVLPVTYKCLWEYLRSKCDCSGVWTPNKRLAEFSIGETIDWDRATVLFKEQVEVLENGKWWLKDFVSFQYGALSYECRPHHKVIEVARKNGLSERVLIGYSKGINTLEDKDKEKEYICISKKHAKPEEATTPPKTKHLDTVHLTTEEFEKLVGQYGEQGTKRMIEILDNYKGSHGKKYKSDYKAILNWVVQRYLEEQKLSPTPQVDNKKLEEAEKLFGVKQ